LTRRRPILVWFLVGVLSGLDEASFTGGESVAGGVCFVSAIGTCHRSISYLD
jgi:hypothetical protein